MLARFAANGDSWTAITVEPGSPMLVDRTGSRRVATADPDARVIALSSELAAPDIDRVLVHEVAHALTMGGRLLDEAAAQLIERHAVEAVAIASGILGRPVCVDGTCLGT